MTQESTDLDHLFAVNLAKLREQKGLSKTDLARLMQEAGWESYSQMTVSRTESESRKVGVAEAHALSQVMDVSYSQLLQSGEEQQLQWRIDRIRRRHTQLSGLVGRILVFQEEIARIIDQMGGEIPEHMRSDVTTALSWSAVQFVREEVAQHFAEEAAELGLLNQLEDGDTSFIYGPLERRLRDRIAHEFDQLKEIVDNGVDQEEG